MSYDDGRVACTDDAVVIRGYYFPFGEKRVPYVKIKQVTSQPANWMGKWRVWGSSDLVHWYNYDPQRPSKSTALVITPVGRGVHPVITPDHPDEVIAELAAHGVTVTTP
jgi:hypothetical protein